MKGSKKKNGFTIVELLVTTSIFILMTGLMLARYGNFNQGVLLTNLAYDLALTIRTAQTYGVGVQKTDSNQYQYAYGVVFCANTSGCNDIYMNNQQVILFVDSNSNKIYSGSGEKVTTYNIKRGARILGFCTEVNCSEPDNSSSAHITFIRPNPDARIYTIGSSISEARQYIKIFIEASDGSIRTVSVRWTGQVTVDD